MTQGSTKTERLEFTKPTVEEAIKTTHFAVEFLQRVLELELKHLKLFSEVNCTTKPYWSEISLMPATNSEEQLAEEKDIANLDSCFSEYLAEHNNKEETNND